MVCICMPDKHTNFFTTVLSRWMMIEQCKLQMLHDASSSNQGVPVNNQDNATNIMLCEARKDSNLGR